MAAVSGGSDSTALLVLLKDWLARSGNSVRLVAATVDHNLRAASAAEARAVAALAARLGIAHRTLVWEGAKPAAGLMAAARGARHRLLAEAAEKEGARIVFTAHTADDQAETVMMRQARGDGPGLAGIAPASLFAGKVWIVRPLLGVRRAALREMLRKRGLGWTDDPSNADRRFERVRIRTALSGDEGRIASLLRCQAEAAERRTALSAAAGRLIAATATMPAAGLVRLSPGFPHGGEASLHALRLLLATVGGRRHLPASGPAKTLLEGLARPPFRATLCGTVADARRSGIYLLREARGLPRLSLAAGISCWDGRYEIDAAKGDPAIEIGPQGDHAEPDGGSGDEIPQSLLREAAAAEPGLWRGGGLVGGLASAAGMPARRIVAPFATFLPVFDLAAADALADLFGRARPPRPPFTKAASVGLTNIG